VEQCKAVAGHSNVKHEAASAHTFLDRLKLVKQSVLNKTDINPQQMGLKDNVRATQKYVKVCIGRVVTTRPICFKLLDGMFFYLY
jgi:hypothetical protein